jgi:hypothetical protein
MRQLALLRRAVAALLLLLMWGCEVHAAPTSAVVGGVTWLLASPAVVAPGQPFFQVPCSSAWRGVSCACSESRCFVDFHTALLLGGRVRAVVPRRSGPAAVAVCG